MAQQGIRSHRVSRLFILKPELEKNEGKIHSVVDNQIDQLFDTTQHLIQIISTKSNFQSKVE